MTTEQDKNFSINEKVRALGRMTTGVERVFRQMPDGLYREIYLHFIHFLDEKGNKTSSKLQQQIEGKLYRQVGEHEKHLRSVHGEVEYTFPESDNPVRLIALDLDYSDLTYGRGR